MKNKKKENNNKKLLLLLFIVGVFATAGFLIYIMLRDLWPIVQNLVLNVNDKQESVDYIHTYGWKGVPILIGLEALFALISVIPAAPVHVLAGLCYGVVWGTIIAVVGGFIGNSITFFLFKQFHVLFDALVKPKDKNFLGRETVANMKHPEILIWLAYTIPGFPNLIVPYLFSRTMPYWRYILTVTAVGVPGIVMLTATGDVLAQGNWMFMGGLVGVMVVIGFVVYLNRERLMKLIGK